MEKKLIPLVALTLGGVAFSGYLSALKLFSSVCAFGESCAIFLGLPACYFGFTMYVVMFAVTLLGLLGKIAYKKVLSTDLLVSFMGILFAGNFAVREFINGRAFGVLGFSTCVYGLIFYIAIFIITLNLRGSLENKEEAPKEDL